jgi:cytoskeletal protein CcmA (bactofilin family)
MKMNRAKLLALAILLFAVASAGALGAAATPAFAQTQSEVVVQVDSQDRVAFDEDLTIPEGEVVEGNVSVTNGDLAVYGTVMGKVNVVNGDVDVYGSIARELAVLSSGDITLHEGSKVGSNIIANGDINLKDGSVVNGSVTSLGGTVTRSPGAQIAGALNRVDTPDKALEHFVKPWAGMYSPGSVVDSAGSGWNSVLARFGGIFGMGMFSVLALGLSLALTAILPGRVRTTTYTLQAEPGPSIIVGLITALLLFPVAGVIAVLLTVSMVGIVLLPLLALAVLAVLLFGFVVAGHWLGRRIHDSMRHGELTPNGLNGHQTPALAIEVIIGTAVILGSVFVPALFLPAWASFMLLGVVYLVSCLGVGAAILSRFGTLAPPRRHHQRTVMYPTAVHSHYGTTLPHTPPERHNTRPLGHAPVLPADEQARTR